MFNKTLGIVSAALIFGLIPIVSHADTGSGSGSAVAPSGSSTPTGVNKSSNGDRETAPTKKAQDKPDGASGSSSASPKKSKKNLRPTTPTNSMPSGSSKVDGQG